MKFTLSWKKLCDCSLPEFEIFPVGMSFNVYKNIPFSKTISPEDNGFHLSSLNPLLDTPTNIDDYSLKIDLFNTHLVKDFLFLGNISNFQLTINRRN